MTPSEILGELRNDGRSKHHRAMIDQALRELEEKVEALKSAIIRPNPPDCEQVGCA
jgi:hypothetical protein